MVMGDGGRPVRDSGSLRMAGRRLPAGAAADFEFPQERRGHVTTAPAPCGSGHGRGVGRLPNESSRGSRGAQLLRKAERMREQAVDTGRRWRVWSTGGVEAPPWLSAGDGVRATAEASAATTAARGTRVRHGTPRLPPRQRGLGSSSTSFMTDDEVRPDLLLLDARTAAD
jgi:hypothetical protein